MKHSELAELVASASAGDESAWNSIVTEFAPLVWSVVRGFRFGEAEARDAAQTTWLRLVENLDRIREPERFAGWLQTTTRRTCLQLLHTNRRECPVDPADAMTDRSADRALSAELASPDDGVIRRDEIRLVRAAMSRLGPRDRALLTMLSASEVPDYARISVELSMPIGSIGPTRGRALTRLRAALESVTREHARHAVAAGVSAPTRVALFTDN